MAREIICIHVGGCGLTLGLAFWDMLRDEHGLESDGRFVARGDGLDDERRAKIEVFFRRASADRYVPRAALVDLEPGTLDAIRSSPIGSLFRPDNFVLGQSGAGNNWAKGHYTEGAELIDAVVDVVRREVEACDAPQGFILFHALGGGTGSGLGTLILSKLRAGYPRLLRATASVFPSAKLSDVVVEPYNALLSVHQLIENADLTLVLDNEALFDLVRRAGVATPRYSDLNAFITQALSGATASLRLPAHANADLRALATNLVPFPRLHFIDLAHAPLALPGARPVRSSLARLSAQLAGGRCSLSAGTLGPTWAATPIYRGALTDAEIHDLVRDNQASFAGPRIGWISTGLTPSRVRPPARRANISATLLANSQGVKGVFQRIGDQFTRLFKRKAFLHWYTGEGMDEMEFQEADRNLRQLVSEYVQRADPNPDEN
ncbi:MAG: tubulin beta chain [Myxococcales bacterium]|nr:tubulin beta chain [Myxococcales bacterium]